MRLHLGAIPSSPHFVPEGSWRPLREPSPWLMQILALPIGLMAALIVALLWFAITPSKDLLPALSAPAFLLSFGGIVVVHELIHAAAHPRAGWSPCSVLGFWPSRLVFYAHYDGELTRNRFVAILVMPLVVISFVPLIVASLSGLMSGWVVFISTFNALLACGDLLGVGIVLFQVPATAIVRNQGWRTYWREAE